MKAPLPRRNAPPHSTHAQLSLPLEGPPPEEKAPSPAPDPPTKTTPVEDSPVPPLREPPPHHNAYVFTVSELSRDIGLTFAERFQHIRVRGEIGALKRVASGHLFFELRDGKAVVRAAVWAARRASLGMVAENGFEVVVEGKLVNSGRNSGYLIDVRSMRLSGVGALLASLERLRRKLHAEGLFAPERKRPIPFLPQTVAVITSPTGSVVSDIIHRLRARFLPRVLVFPVTVQGQRTLADVLNALQTCNALAALRPEQRPVPLPDVIIIARGGGSIEDLLPFSHEEMVRAVATSRVPVVTAIGHETDTPLIDHAADLRAPTPTAAAELVVPVRTNLLEQIDGYWERMNRAGHGDLLRRRKRLPEASRLLNWTRFFIRQTNTTLREREQALQIRLRRRAEDADHRFRVLATKIRPSLRPRQDRIANGRNGLIRAIVSRMARARLILEHTRLPDTALRHRLTHQQRHAAAMGRAAVQAFRQTQNVARGRLAHTADLLDSVGYTNTLQRGFAIVLDESGRVVRSRRQGQSAPRLTLRFHDGRLDTRPINDPGDPPREAP